MPALTTPALAAADLRDYVTADTAPSATPFTAFSVPAALQAYDDLLRALPLDEVWYAVKAQPVPELITALSERGCGFDVASVPEIDLCLAAGAQPHQLSHGNPIRSLEELHQAAERGVRTWIVDSVQEVERLAVAAPGSRVLIRLAVAGEGSDWPLSLRFGCGREEARALGRVADRLGLDVAGFSFHVGSLQRDTGAWEAPLAMSAAVGNDLAADGIGTRMVNLGGGLPGPGYRRPAPDLDAFGRGIRASLERVFPQGRPRLVAEPGRSLVAAAGASVVRVKAVVERTDGDTYVFLDGGVFNLGLVEGMDGSVEYRITAPDHPEDAETMAVQIHGPSCDSVDQLKAKSPYRVPRSLHAGDRLVIWDTGSYSASYAATAFNGMPPAPLVVL